MLAGLLHDVPFESLPSVLNATSSVISLRVPSTVGEIVLRPFSRALPVQVLVGDHSGLLNAVPGGMARLSYLNECLGLRSFTGTCTCGSLLFTITSTLPPCVHAFSCPTLASGRPLIALPRGCLNLEVRGEGGDVRVDSPVAVASDIGSTGRSADLTVKFRPLLCGTCTSTPVYVVEESAGGVGWYAIDIALLFARKKDSVSMSLFPSSSLLTSNRTRLPWVIAVHPWAGLTFNTTTSVEYAVRCVVGGVSVKGGGGEGVMRPLPKHLQPQSWWRSSSDWCEASSMAHQWRVTNLQTLSTLSKRMPVLPTSPEKFDSRPSWSLPEDSEGGESSEEEYEAAAFPDVLAKPLFTSSISPNFSFPSIPPSPSGKAGQNGSGDPIEKITSLVGKQETPKHGISDSSDHRKSQESEHPTYHPKDQDAGHGNTDTKSSSSSATNAVQNAWDAFLGDSWGPPLTHSSVGLPYPSNSSLLGLRAYPSGPSTSAQARLALKSRGVSVQSSIHSTMFSHNVTLTRHQQVMSLPGYSAVPSLGNNLQLIMAPHRENIFKLYTGVDTKVSPSDTGYSTRDSSSQGTQGMSSSMQLIQQKQLLQQRSTTDASLENQAAREFPPVEGWMVGGLGGPPRLPTEWTSTKVGGDWRWDNVRSRAEYLQPLPTPNFMAAIESNSNAITPPFSMEGDAIATRTEFSARRSEKEREKRNFGRGAAVGSTTLTSRLHGEAKLPSELPSLSLPSITSNTPPSFKQQPHLSLPVSSKPFSEKIPLAPPSFSHPPANVSSSSTAQIKAVPSSVSQSTDTMIHQKAEKTRACTPLPPLSSVPSQVVTEASLAIAAAVSSFGKTTTSLAPGVSATSAVPYRVDKVEEVLTIVPSATRGPLSPIPRRRNPVCNDHAHSNTTAAAAAATVTENSAASTTRGNDSLLTGLAPPLQPSPEVTADAGGAYEVGDHHGHVQGKPNVGEEETSMCSGIHGGSIVGASIISTAAPQSPNPSRILSVSSSPTSLSRSLVIPPYSPASSTNHDSRSKSHRTSPVKSMQNRILNLSADSIWGFTARHGGTTKPSHPHVMLASTAASTSSAPETTTAITTTTTPSAASKKFQGVLAPSVTPVPFPSSLAVTVPRSPARQMSSSSATSSVPWKPAGSATRPIASPTFLTTKFTSNQENATPAFSSKRPATANTTARLGLKPMALNSNSTPGFKAPPRTPQIL